MVACCGIALAAPVAWGQDGAPPASTGAERVQVAADSAFALEQGGERLRRLLGDVQVRQERTRLWARRAVQYLAREQFLFEGDVLIIDEGDSLWADEVLYDSRLKTGRAVGNVRLSDGEVEVFAPSGLYFTEPKRTEFEEGVRLVDSLTVLTSRAGTYWSNEKRAEFYGDVLLESDRSVLAADSVTYYRETEVSVARGRVFIERAGGEEAAEADAAMRTLLFGSWAYNDNRQGYSRLTGRPLLVQLRADTARAEVDTLLIRAVELEAFREDSLQRLIALDSVRIWQARLAAVADSVVYDRFEQADGEVHEVVRLYREPMAWFQQSQVSGDTLRLKGRAGSVDTLFVRQRTFLAQQDTVLDRVQQLRGHHLLGVFERDSLRSLDVGPNAEAIYYLQEEGQPSGAVRTSGDRILFFFEANELHQIKVLSGVESTYYAEELLPASFALEGFAWLPDQRPIKAGLLDEAYLRQRLAQRGAALVEEAPKAGEGMPPLDEAPAEGPEEDSGMSFLKQRQHE